MEKEYYTAKDLAALFKEIVADTEAGKREDAHPREKEAFQKILDEESKVLTAEKTKETKGIEL